MKNHDIIEVCCKKKHETDKAILVVNLKNKDVWLPKSQIEIDSDEKGIVELHNLPLLLTIGMAFNRFQKG